ncbi:MAG: hypothetical protein G01um101425_620 [Candidatus Peregrinibacteria bacterium Gr01-1014_25]|nr:MAG: hypothetical protein G01um101425_620 [Candidatus Peregrinibacteria bacterium Gr01-1014_25]
MSRVLKRTAGCLAALSAWAAMPAGAWAAGNLVIPKDKSLRLLQPLGAKTTVDPQAGLGVFWTYVNDIWPWVLGIAAGIALLHAMAAGVQIMFSGSSEKAAEGKERLFWALGGLLLIFFAAFILNLLNDQFFLIS